MKSLIWLLTHLIEDFGQRCSVSTSQDVKTILSRFENEGLSYLTITLPAFSDGFTKALSEGRIRPSHIPSHRYKGALPLFLRGFTAGVFDSESGVLLDDPDIDCIYAVRQITMLLGKLRGTCTPRRTHNAISSYVKCDSEVRDAVSLLSDLDIHRFRRAFFRIFGEVCDQLNRDVESGTLIPRHGPGATAERLYGNQKFSFTYWPGRLEPFFPSADFCLPNARYWKSLERLDFREPGTEMPSRLISVPKTQKTPRLIAIEPAAMQYCQQALMERLVHLLENGQTNRFSGVVGFEDQTISREMARLGSRDGTFATLDLSEASDRVSNRLVLEAFKYWPALSGAVQACRSMRVDVPGHGVLTLSKFASMGSAVTFPIEAMVFTAIILIGIEKQLNTHLSSGELRVVLDDVRVYGDDLIVVTDFADSVCESLELYGLKVNSRKSFQTGKFRESCGGDYYDGVDITSVRVRTELPSNRSDTAEIISTVSLRNQLYQAGLWKICRALDELLGGIIPYPAVDSTSEVLGKVSFLGYDVQRMDPFTHSPLVKGCRVVPVPVERSLDGEGALLKYFLKRGDHPAEKEHLRYSGRPRVVRIKHGWMQPF